MGFPKGGFSDCGLNINNLSNYLMHVILNKHTPSMRATLGVCSFNMTLIECCPVAAYSHNLCQ